MNKRPLTHLELAVFSMSPDLLQPSVYLEMVRKTWIVPSDMRRRIMTDRKSVV